MHLLAKLIPNLFLWIWLLLVLFIGGWNGLIILAFIWILTSTPVAQTLVAPLENRFKQPSLMDLNTQGIQQVVVLVGGGSPQRGEIATSALTPASINRFLAAFELCSHLGPNCKLVCSGSSGPAAYLPTSDMMKNVASAIAPSRAVVAEAESRTTAEHPVYLRKYLEDKEFILVTSAYHMPRAMRIFRDAKLSPLAFPVDYLYTPRKNYSWSDFLPSTDNLQVVEIAIREYFATLLYMLAKR